MSNDFLFKVVESEMKEGLHHFRVCINPDHSIFEGHFPNMPVMPGVCTLDMTKQIISGVVGSRLRYSQIKDCKFLAAILPREEPLLNVKLELSDALEGDYKVNCEISSNDLVMLKLKATLTNDQ